MGVFLFRHHWNSLGGSLGLIGWLGGSLELIGWLIGTHWVTHWNWWIRGTNKNRTEKIEKVIATETHSQLENYFIFLHFALDK
mgnify:CR=1 FL=1